MLLELADAAVANEVVDARCGSTGAVFATVDFKVGLDVAWPTTRSMVYARDLAVAIIVSTASMACEVPLVSSYWHYGEELVL